MGSIFQPDDTQDVSSSMSPDDYEEGSSSSSSSSLQPGVFPPDLADKDKVMYVLLIKPSRMDSPEMHEFPDYRKGMKFLCEWLDLQSTGEFRGRVYAFYGQMINYTTPIKQYKVTFGGRDLEISMSGDAEFVGHMGGTQDI